MNQSDQDVDASAGASKTGVTVVKAENGQITEVKNKTATQIVPAGGYLAIKTPFVYQGFGVYSIRTTADVDNDVTEKDENNNIRTSSESADLTK